MDYCYTIYIPEAVPSWLRDNLEWAMADHFGGYTKVKTEGAWVNPETQKTIKESTFVYQMVTEDDKDIAMKAIAASIKLNTGEIEVLWTKAPIMIGRE